MSKWMKMALVCALGGCVLFTGCDDDDGGGGVDSGPDPMVDAGPPLPGEDAGPGGGGSCSDPANLIMVSGEIDTDTTWECPNLYILSGNVFVTNGATLTITEGVEIVGDPGASEAASLIITRGSQIDAQGTAESPIVMTSGANIGARATGDWAGLAMLGAAGTNSGTDCNTPGACDGGDGDYFENNIEGISVADPRGRYGGTDDASSCGTLRYVRIEFAGRELSPNNELNGLTLGGCGSGTTLDYVQVHRGKDDGIEFFGGTASLSHIVISGASDDSLDFDEGWRGNGQFIVIHQFEGLGDRGIESDNLGSNEAATPRTEVNLWNVTMIGTEDNAWALHREGMLGVMGNFLVHNYGSPVDIRANTEDPNGFWPDRLSYSNSVFNSVGTFPAEDLDDAGVCMEAMNSWSGSAWVDATCDDLSADPAQEDHYGDVASARLDDDFGLDEQAALSDAARANMFDVDPMFSSITASAPSYVPGNTGLPAGTAPVFNANAPSGFGDTGVGYVGAIDPSGTDWTAGWTAFPAN